MSCKMDANRHGTGYDQQCQFEPTTAILTLQFPPGRSTTGPAANASLSTSVLTSSGSLLATGGPQPDVLNYAWRDYGNRVGVFRLAELFADLKLPVSLLVNAEMYRHAPQAVAAFRDVEIIGHGRTNSERQGTLTEAEELTLIGETTAAIEKHSGKRPQGWLGPWISQSLLTPDLLQEAGYRYLLDWCHDDQPIWMKTRRGRMLSIPYPQELNDIPQIVARKREGSDFADMIVDAFEVMHHESKKHPL